MSIRLSPFRERDLEFLSRLATDPAFSAPFEWFGFRWSPDLLRRRWEEDGFLTKDPHYLAIIDDRDVAVGWVMWREEPVQGHGVWEIGALLAPEHRGRGAGTAAQRLLIEHLFSTTPAHPNLGGDGGRQHGRAAILGEMRASSGRFAPRRPLP